MKITGVESFLVADAHYVRIRTEDGLTGLGQSGCWAYPEAVDQVIRRFAEYLIGRESEEIERHWHHLYRMGPFRGTIPMAAVSAVDIALWDLKGKALGVPVWQLLGGRARDRIRLCAFVGGDPDGSLRDEVAKARGDGFTALKISPLPAGYRDVRHAELVRFVARYVEVVREAAPNADLVIEFGRTLSATRALSLIDAVTPYGPLFVEDPIQIDSIREQARFAERARVAIAHGERLLSIWEFQELLSSGGPEVVRPDLGLAGGISHVRKIAAVAESFHSEISPHNCLGPVISAAAIHLGIAVPNFLLLEYSPRMDEGDPASGITTHSIRRDGYIDAPQAPGLGVEIDTDRTSDARYLERPLHRIPVSADGFPG